MTDVFPRRNLPGEAEQWGRAHDERVIELEKSVVVLRQALQAQNRSTASTLSNLADQINALPVVKVGADSRTGFGLNVAGWVTVATVSIPVPTGRTRASVVAVAGGSAIDLTSGGITSVEARISIDGQYSPIFFSAKDAGASVVNNILTPSYGRGVFTASGADVGVILQFRGLNPAAFPPSSDNFSSLTVTATF